MARRRPRGERLPRARRAGVARCCAIALAAAAGCTTTEGVGRCGPYADTPGTARIASVETAPPGESSCTNDPVRVLFDFAPQDPARTDLAATAVPLTIGSGQHPPRAWVTSSGLTVGSEHPAVRSDQQGPCPPVTFRLTDVDAAAALPLCYR
ncbi:MAG TPA: hypothetical protein VFL83_03820 [Anaeromyxobacter sp.]|nr:hypothetical protein [Anaeromyxobacter sp.]